MFKKRNAFIGLLIACILIVPVSAADWQMFHENQEHTGFLKEAADFTSQVWYFQAGGPIQSSPAVLNKIIFFGSNSGNVYAVDMEDGTKLWDYKTGGGLISSP